MKQDFLLKTLFILKSTVNEYYQKAIWKEFNIKTMKDYHNLHNQSDVLLQADIFENFTGISMKHYDLYLHWYFAASSLAWDAEWKLIKIELELHGDLYMLLMNEDGIRGEILAISHRHA